MKKYIIRLDDVSPTMNHLKWKKVFDILDRQDIKPIVAVIPNNKDKEMIIDEPNQSYWDEVREMQSKGYSLALHGYTHFYSTEEKGIVPLNARSEFAGLEEEEQRDKIKKAWKIFKEEGIESDIWIAPSHSFDKTTLKVLKEETTISIVSDGIAYLPYNEDDFFWIPQQTSRIEEQEFGIWTICLHPNSMSEEKMIALEHFIQKNKKLMINDINILKTSYSNRKKSLKDRIFKEMFFYKRAIVKSMALYKAR